MARYAIGDVQGCHAELRALLTKIHFRADRDTLWLVGDLVNRGPASLAVLRLVRALGANAITVLGNHDLHLLAVALGSERRRKAGDTLDAVLRARDRERLFDWLIGLPLAHHDPASGDLLVHAGVAPQWTKSDTLRLAAETALALQRQPRRFLSQMYGDKPDRWSPDLRGMERHRFVVNVLTRLRYCDAHGRIDLEMKDSPGAVAPRLPATAMRPWFAVPGRRTARSRIICGHWSTLGLLRKSNLLALDTGCVWGGQLTAVDLDDGRIFQQASTAGRRVLY